MLQRLSFADGTLTSVSTGMSNRIIVSGGLLVQLCYRTVH